MKKYSLGSLNVVVSFCSNNEARVYLKIMRYFKKTLRDTNFKFIFTYRKSTTGICHTTNLSNSLIRIFYPFIKTLSGLGMGRFHNGVDSNRFQNRTVQASESTLESTQSRLHYTKIKMFHRKNYNNSGGDE